MSGPVSEHESPLQIPALSQAAFLLDFDGTLVDIAPTPESVIVPETLPQVLRKLRALCGDALAVVSGRPIDQIDHFLGDIPFAVAGEHGIAIRHRPGGEIEKAALPVVPPLWLAEAQKLTDAWPGTRLEHKQAGFVLHYRGTPEAGNILKKEASNWLTSAKGAFHLQAAKMAWEVRPTGIDKGYAVAALMEHFPFAGRKPVFVGDDVTDEDGIAAAKRLGGVGLRIPTNFANPAALRAWLSALVKEEG